MNINGIIVNPENDALVESHTGSIINGYSATREIRETPDGRRYSAVVTHPDGRVRVEVEADGVRWIRFPSGVIEGTRLADGAPVEPTRSPASAAAAALGSIRSDRKAAASRANGAKGGRPVTSVEDCFCSGRRGFGTARGYYADGRFRVSAREAARLVRVWELGTPENLSKVYVLDDSGRRVPVWTR